MKRLVLLTVCLVAFVTNSFAQNGYKGEQGVSSVGGIFGYSFDNEAMMFGVDYRYNVRDQIRLAPSILYAIEHDDVNTLYINADAHYLVRMTEKITIYPVGGLGFSIWSLEVPKSSVTHEAAGYFYTESETKVRLGLNLGFGGEIRMTKDMILGAEFRYNLTTDNYYNQAMILTRVAYYF